MVGGRRLHGSTVGDPRGRGLDVPPTIFFVLWPVFTMATCLVGLGSNLGDRRQTIDLATELIDQHSLARVTACSRIYETKPIGGPDGQGSYLNAAIKLETSLAPKLLLRRLQEFEAKLGRTRGEQWSARTIDLDLLLYDRVTLSTRQLTLPHPRLAFRRFVLEPSAEIAADMMVADTDWTVEKMLKHVNSQPNHVAIVCEPKSFANELASRTVRALNEQFDVPAQLLNESIAHDDKHATDDDTTGHDPDADIEFRQRSGIWFVSGGLQLFPQIRKSKLLITLRSDVEFPTICLSAKTPTLIVSLDDEQAAFNEITSAILAMHDVPQPL